MLPPILMRGCSHSDPQCICRNLRSLDDYDDTPKPPTRRVKLLKRTPDEVFEDGTTTEEVEVEVTIIEVSNIENNDQSGIDEEADNKSNIDNESVGVEVDHAVDASNDAISIEGGDKESQHRGDSTTKSGTLGSELSENMTADDEAIESNKTELEKLGDPSSTGKAASILLAAPKDGLLADAEVEVASTKNENPGKETTKYEENSKPLNKTGTPASEIPEPEKAAYEKIKNETFSAMEEEREFKMCVEECSLQDQIRML